MKTDYVVGRITQLSNNANNVPMFSETLSTMKIVTPEEQMLKRIEELENRVKKLEEINLLGYTR